MLRLENIEAAAFSASTKLFILMLNPKMRGPNFRFDNHCFEDLIVCVCDLSFNLTEDEKLFLRNRLKNIWNGFIKDSAVLEWIDKQQ